MNIALFGYGRMGKAIEKIALQRGHNIVLKIDSTKDLINFDKVDIAIDFSMPTSAYENIARALQSNIPIVSGTTGWLDKFDDIVNLCEKTNGSFLYASNFSLGVNIFFELNEKLAQLMQKFDYTPSITEIHHIKKLDAPSGTAISLAEQILPYSKQKEWQLDTKEKDILNISAERIEDIPGTHIVSYISDIDEIEIKHRAKNRDGFAQGAVLAAEYIVNKKGVFTMKDVLDL